MASTYSAKIEMVCVDADDIIVMSSASVWIVRAESFGSAFDQSINIGESQEKSYINADGRVVQWKLKQISTLDLVDIDGDEPVEVHHEFDEDLNGQVFELKVKPEDNPPP